MTGPHDQYRLSSIFKSILKQLNANSKQPSQEELNSLSSLGIKYPPLRDHHLHTGHQWLEGKRQDDGAEQLWRIYDNLYDFSDFVDEHPGGKDWLKLTKGTDITEAFEAHHISAGPGRMLAKYFIRKAKSPRNSPFTFEENGFYKTLKRKIHKQLLTIPRKPATRSKYLTDLLFISYLTTAVLTVYFKSFSIGILSGMLLAMTANAAHNFFHQRDNFRMYYFDFSFMQSREWRISHALSHHIYTNTVNDLEISSVEPFLQYLPKKKSFILKYFSWIYSPVVYFVVFFVHYIKTAIQMFIVGERFTWPMLLPLSVPIFINIVTNESITFCCLMYFWIVSVGSVYFSIVGLNAAHHHPEIFHDGDTPRPKEEMDWGIFQLDAVMDRKDITGSHFLVLTNFGDHALHHLFPTIDHGLLEYLYPVFKETCEEFGLEWKLSSQIELVKGQYRQLAKDKPNPFPPKPIVKDKREIS